MLTAITGINWGDEGKGRMVDLLSQDYDVVVRYQGGNNAGHTVVNHLGKFILNLLPSGILRPEVVNVMGNGMVIDLEHLCGEMKRLTDAGVSISPANLKISDKAVICMPYHKLLDCLEEDRLGDAWKNLTITGVYGAPAVSFDEMWDWLQKFGGQVKDYICDAGLYLDAAEKSGKKILFEAQLGALRDIDFGIYPYTSSSSSISAYAPVGAGIPNHKLSLSIGIMKAYSTCVGEGPFTAELFGEEAEELRKAGGEYGAATGRPRRVGGFDVPASRYGVRVQGADELAVTKLDVLSYMDKIPVCVAYDVNGRRVEEFPTGADLNAAKPIYEYFPGWHCDISSCRKPEDLPIEALDYIRYLEKAVGCPVKYVSVGAEREEYLTL